MSHIEFYTAIDRMAMVNELLYNYNKLKSQYLLERSK